MIEIEGISRYYGDFCAVDNLSLSVKKGEILGLLGPNGAGKSTTLRMMTGYLPPSAGSVLIDGTDVQEEPVKAKSKIGYLPESSAIYSDMLVYDYLSFIAEMHDIQGVEREIRINELSTLCSLKEAMHKSVSVLSKGYQQRVGLALAMMSDPDILILDEPTSGLDPNQIIEIRSIIKSIGKSKTVLFSTHILSEAEATCDRVVIINRGKIVADGDVETLTKSQKGQTEISLKLSSESSTTLSTLEAVEGVLSVTSEKSGGEVTFHLEASHDVRKELIKLCAEQEWDLLEITSKTQSLEALFTQLTKEDA